MDEQWPHSWEALRAGLKPAEKTTRNAGRAGLLGFHFFAAASASYMDGMPWLEEGGLGSVVVPAGIWKHLVEPLGL